MSGSDNLESDSDQPLAKKAKSHYDTLSSHHTQQSSQGSQNIIIETGHHQDQLNTRHTINVIVNNNKKERQKRYREQNRDKLKQREAERRKRIQYSQSIAGPSTSSNTNRIELNNEEIITAQSSFSLEETQLLSIQRNEQGNEINALQKKRERQQRYREQNRDKLKQREAERRRRLQNAEMITELSTSPNIEFTEIINDPIIDEISTDSRSEAGLEEMQYLVVEVSQQNNEDSPSGNEVKIFCPKCNTEVQHTAEGIQEDQTKILVAKVYHYFECEYEELKKKYGDLDLTPLSKFCQRTALATGVSEARVLQILKEEEERNAEKREEKKECRARKRPISTESSTDEESSDDSVSDGGQPSCEQEAQNEPDVETLVVKIEPECDKDQVQTSTIPVQVKAEPPDDDTIYTTETLATTEPAATKRKGKKIPRSDVTSTQQHRQGEPSTSAALRSVRLKEIPDESGLLGEADIKVEEMEIGDEQFT